MVCQLLLYLKQKNKSDRIEAYLHSMILWTLFLLVLTYFWSCFHLLILRTVVGSYLLLDGVLLFSLLREKRHVKCSWDRMKEELVQDRFFGACLLIEIVLFLIVFYYAIRCVPYNWDSMTYHLPRITNWRQNRSVFPYATSIERQIASPVLGAYINLFVYMTGRGCDRLLNLLQCCSYGTNAVLLYGLSRKLGVGKRLSLLAPLLYFGMPIALAEATTTQVDNFSTLWLLAFLYLMIDAVKSEHPLLWCREERTRFLYASACIALGYLAKPSVCFAILLFLIWLFVVLLKNRTQWIVMGKYLLLAAGTILTILLPNQLIMLYAFGTLSYSGVGQRQLIGTWNPKYILVNFLKNFTFNLAPAKWENGRILIERFLYRLSESLSVDLNAPSISEDGRIFTFPGMPALSCDTALNMFLMVTAILSAFVCLATVHKQKKEIRGFSVYAGISFVVFCCFLRWEQYITRYMISYFALLILFIVLQTHVLFMRKKVLLYRMATVSLVVGSLINFCIGVQYLNQIAPFYAPGGYFVYRENVRESYMEIAERLKAGGVGKIGLVIHSDTFEYPIWAMLRGEGYEIRHIMVNNALKGWEQEDFVPDYIIVEGFAEGSFQYHGTEYKNELHVNEPFMSLYIK